MIEIREIESGKILSARQNYSKELSECLKEAKSYALKGIIGGMDYSLKSALKYSKIIGSDISDELKEIKELALENYDEFRSVSDLVSWLKIESRTVNPVFLSNVLGYAKSVADIFGWDIEKQLKEHGYKPESKKIIPLKKVKKSCRIIRIAGYADL